MRVSWESAKFQEHKIRQEPFIVSAELIFSYFCEKARTRDATQKLEWSHYAVSFSRGKKGVSGTVNYAICTGFPVQLELPRRTVARDMLHDNYDYNYFVY